MKSKRNLIIIAIVIVISLFGITYAFFEYYGLGSNQKITAGKVSLILNEGNDTIIRENIFPETVKKARSATDNFITFTVSGVNTTTDNDIYYEIMLNEGDSETGKTRFNPEDLVFDLVELNADGSEGNYLVDAKSYSDFNAKRIWVDTVDRNTATTINKTYKLRMWLSEDVLISDSNPNANYPSTGYKNHYASVKVSVYGDFVYKDIAMPASCFTYNVIADPDVITYDYPIITLDTSDEKVTSCKTIFMTAFEGDVSIEQDGYQKFCEGTGKADFGQTGVLTLKEFVAFGLQIGASKEELISMTGEVVTDIVTETRNYELNTSVEAVNSCKEFMLNFSKGEDFSEDGDGFQKFCSGTGTADGLTIFEVLNEVHFLTYFFVENNILTQLESSSVIEITDYDETCGTDVVIPSHIEGVPVTRIADGEVIYEEDSVKILSPFGSKNITSVNFPNTLKYIGESSFENNRIEKLEIGTNVRNIGDSAFGDNPLVNVDIKGSTTLGSGSFCMDDVYNDVFKTFHYGGTCERLNKYEGIFISKRAPQTIITSDSNSCDYENYPN